MKLLLLSLSLLTSALLFPPKDVWEIFAAFTNDMDYKEASREYVSTPLYTEEIEALDQTIISIKGYPYLENQKDHQGRAIIILSKEYLDMPSAFYPSESALIQIYSKEEYTLQEKELYTFQGTLHLNREQTHYDPKTLDLKKGESTDLPFQLKTAICLNCSKN